MHLGKNVSLERNKNEGSEPSVFTKIFWFENCTISKHFDGPKENHKILQGKSNPLDFWDGQHLVFFFNCFMVEKLQKYEVAAWHYNDATTAEEGSSHDGHSITIWFVMAHKMSFICAKRAMACFRKTRNTFWTQAPWL